MLLDFSRIKVRKSKPSAIFQYSSSFVLMHALSDHLLYPNDQLSTSHTDSVLYIRIINFNMPLSLYFILITALDCGAPGFFAISEKDIGFLSLFGLFSVFFTTCAGWHGKGNFSMITKTTRVDARIISDFTCFCCRLQKKKVTMMITC